MANGKGDARRPAFIPEEDLGRRWHETFGNRQLPSNPAVARSRIEAASGAQVEQGRMDWQKTDEVFRGMALDALADRAEECNRVLGIEPYEVEHKEIDGKPVTALTAADQLPSPAEIAEAFALCPECGESIDHATKCHRACWQKNPGPRRK